ncbi:MAG: hypothetical protein IPG50_11115 [Myxococcales bacterium]|nr:hypothetical protein [Myxococcales bacterium]
MEEHISNAKADEAAKATQGRAQATAGRVVAWLARHKTTLKRWLDVLVQATVAASVSLVVLPRIVEPIYNVVSQALWASSPIDRAVAMLVGGAALVGLAIRARRVVGTSRSIRAYPPTWIAVALGLAFVFGFYAASQMVRAHYPGLGKPGVGGGWDAIAPVVFLLIVGGCVIAGVLIAVARERLRSRGANQLAGTASPGVWQLPAAPDELRRWLMLDTPVGTAGEDAFGHVAVARRIARRLSGPGQPPSIAVVGSLGAGKSTVRALVEADLKNHARVRVVRISAWPYETTSALLAGALQELSNAVQATVGTPAFGTLSEEYVTAVVGVSERFDALKGLGSLLRAWSKPVRPDRLLAAVDEVLVAVDHTVILWIEDLERFAGVGADGGAKEDEKARERLAPVRALLHQLQETQRIGVVVATTSLLGGFDLEKIARYIEDIDGIAPEKALEVIRGVRKMVLKEWEQKGVIDPASAEVRAKFELALRMDSATAARWGVDLRGRDEWAGMLASLARTPRALKQGLRAFAEASAALPGEVDIDHCLAVSLVRHVAPHFFGEVSVRVDRLRTRRDSAFSSRPDDVGSVALQELTSVAPPAMSAGLVQLVSRIFRSPDGVPQGFHVLEPVDYWRRYLAQGSDGGLFDQAVLQAVAAFPAKAAPAVALAGGPMADQFEHFARFDGATTLRFLECVLDALPKPLVEERRDQRALLAAWRLCLRAERTSGAWDQTAAATVLCSRVRAAVPSDLLLAHELLYRFATEEETVRPLLTPAGRSLVRRGFEEEFVRHFRGEPALLAAALAKRGDVLLAYLTWGIDRVRIPDDSLPFAEWPAFASTVVEAVRVAPQTMVRQVAYLVTDVESRVLTDAAKPTGQFSVQKAQKLFGHAASVLGALPSEELSMDDATPELKARVEALFNAAKYVGPSAAKASIPSQSPDDKEGSEQ